VHACSPIAHCDAVNLSARCSRPGSDPTPPPSPRYWRKRPALHPASRACPPPPCTPGHFKTMIQNGSWRLSRPIMATPGRWCARRRSRGCGPAVRLVTQGATDREVAEHLYISAHAVNSHLRHVFAKLGIRSRVELARLAGERQMA
jgi:Bacterial regulatory proteins, luxR family